MTKADALYQLVWLSRPLMQAAEAAVEQGLDGSGITVRMRAVMEILFVHGELTVPEIATKLEIQRQYVQVMVNETLAEALTEQRANPRHKRSPLLALTPKGQTLIGEVIEREKALMTEISAPMDDAAVTEALRVVQTVTAALKAQTGSGK